MARYVLILGSSQKNGADFLKKAKEKIQAKKQITLWSCSGIYKSQGSKTSYNGLFFNAAVAIFSSLNPKVLYRELMQIENSLGRIRVYKNARRTIDIDVLMSPDFNFMGKEFSIPHKEIAKRSFFVLPAIEALRSARWPVPITLITASFRFGREFLYRVS